MVFKRNVWPRARSRCGLCRDWGRHVLARLDGGLAGRDRRAGGRSAAAHDHNVALPLASFVGEVPENADELAKAHKAYDATLPALQSGDLVRST